MPKITHPPPEDRKAVEAALYNSTLELSKLPFTTIDNLPAHVKERIRTAIAASNSAFMAVNAYNTLLRSAEASASRDQNLQ